MEFKKGIEMSFSDFLYEGECGKCGEELLPGDMIFKDNALGPRWEASCDSCGERYIISVSKVYIEKEL